MKAIGDLNGVGCSLPGAFGVGAGPVPADDLHSGMLFQPHRERAGEAIVEHVDGPVGVHVDQDRGVRMTTPFREVVDAQHRDLPDLGIRQAADQPDQRRPGDRDAERTGQPSAGAPGQGQPDRLQQAAKQQRPALMPSRHGGHLLGEGLQLTRLVVAEEPAHLKIDGVKPPPIAAVDPGRGHPAPMTRRVHRTGPRRDQHATLIVVDPVDMQVTQMREEKTETAGFLACRGMLHNDPRGRSLMIRNSTARSLRSGRTHAQPVTQTRSSRPCRRRSCTSPRHGL